MEARNNRSPTIVPSTARPYLIESALRRERTTMKLRRIVRWTAVVIPLALLLAGLVAYWRSGNACDDRPTAAPGNPMKAIVYCDYVPRMS